MASAQQDLLHVLAREHRDHSQVFHELMDRFHATAPRHRRRQFAALVLHLNVHLAAETLLVHPLLVTATDRGQATRRDREQEIAALQRRLTDVGNLLGDADHLPDALRAASGDVASHADREELEVFVHARHVVEPRELRHLGRLHATLHQRLPARYQREGDAPAEPWTDPRLLEELRAWYAAALPHDSVPDAPS